ncbi:hypothetical protein HOY82DRAFT_402139 [Tuber indicum]|nr:hypothetical protein HOY82DRAFT_402139 [Tuber indicum]
MVEMGLGLFVRRGNSTCCVEWVENNPPSSFGAHETKNTWYGSNTTGRLPRRASHAATFLYNIIREKLPHLSQPTSEPKTGGEDISYGHSDRRNFFHHILEYSFTSIPVFGYIPVPVSGCCISPLSYLPSCTARYLRRHDPADARRALVLCGSTAKLGGWRTGITFTRKLFRYPAFTSSLFHHALGGEWIGMALKACEWMDAGCLRIRRACDEEVEKRHSRGRSGLSWPGRRERGAPHKYCTVGQG